MIKIAICDDEKYYREQMKCLITKYFMQYQTKNYCVDIFSSGKEFCEKESNVIQYDIVFLDIGMVELNGLETAYKIREHRSDTYIIFVTGFFNYALEGYKVDAFRYIMKDTLEISIVECLNAIFKKLKIQMDKMEFKFIEKKRSVYIDEIVYIESRKHKLTFYIMELGLVEYGMYSKLDDIEAQLKEYKFLRIHKSYLVNMKHIIKINSYKITLASGQELSIPKLRYQAVKETFALYKGEL